MPELKDIDVEILKALERIADATARSAGAAEATYAAYKKSMEADKRHMETREEFAREANERAREDFAMSKERHEAFMRNQKATEEREALWLKNVQGSQGKPAGQIIQPS